MMNAHRFRYALCERVRNFLLTFQTERCTPPPIRPSKVARMVCFLCTIYRNKKLLFPKLHVRYMNNNNCNEISSHVLIHRLKLSPLKYVFFIRSSSILYAFCSQLIRAQWTIGIERELSSKFASFEKKGNGWRRLVEKLR